MPQKDDEAAELKHAEEIGFMIIPAAKQSAKIVEPGEETLDSPATAVATQFAAVLRGGWMAIVLVECDESNAVFSPQVLVEECREQAATSGKRAWAAARRGRSR